MFTENPELQREEVEAAIQLRRMHTEVSGDLIRQYAANYFRSDWNTDEPVPENHFHEYLANVMPSLVYGNPRVRVRSRRPVVQAGIAEAIQHAINRWVKDVHLADTVMTLIALDMLFDFGVALTTLSPVPGYNGWQGMKPLRPQVHRISPRRFFMDPQADHPSKARFMGHFWVRDKEDLKRERDKDGRPVYDPEVLDAIVEARGDDAYLRSQYGDSQWSSRRGSVRRNQIGAYSIFVPERRQLYTLSAYQAGNAADNLFLREPREYFGPPWGPYTLFGIYTVPDQVYPLSPLAASGEQVEELNAHAAATSREAARGKVITVVDSSNESLASAVQEGFDGHVYKVNGFTGQHAEIQLGGATPERMNYVAMLRERLDRNSGLTDVARGNVSGQGTATEHALASGASDARTRFLKLRFRWNVMQVLHTAGWYMFHSPHVIFPVPVETSDGHVDGTFYGGVSSGVAAEMSPGQADARYDDLELEIEPYSMEHVSEAVAREQARNTVELYTQLAPIMPQTPWVAWTDLLDFLGENQNQPEFSRFLNTDVLEEVTQIAMAKMRQPDPQPTWESTVAGFKESNPGSGGVQTQQVPDERAGTGAASLANLVRGLTAA